MNTFILKITIYIKTRYFKSFRNLVSYLITYFKKINKKPSKIIFVFDNCF